MPNERRELSEIIARYTAEPQLRGDIYVEGSSDKRFLDWFLDWAGSRGTAVYEIRTVNVPESILDERCLPLGSNRSRVLALAQVLAEAVPEVERRAAFIIDRDFEDHIEGSSWSFPSLFLTNYTALEMYLFQESTIQKFLRVAAGRSSLDSRAFMANLATELTKPFLLRLTNASLGSNVRLLPIEGSLSVTAEGFIHFDTDAYLHNCLTSSRRHGRLDDFRDTMEQYEKTLAADPRLRIHGHDLITVLYWFVHRSRGSPSFRTRESLEVAMFMSMDPDQLRAEQLLKNILIWAGVTAP